MDWNGCVEAYQLYKIWVNFKDDSAAFSLQALHDSKSCLSAQPNELIRTTIPVLNTEIEQNKDTNLIAEKREDVEEAVTKIKNVSPFNINESPKNAMDLLKTCIKWPEKMVPNSSSTRKKDYLPSVLTSDKWKDIMMVKEKEKQDKEEHKQNKINMKKKNKLEINLNAKKKIVTKRQNIKEIESETSEDEEELFSLRDSDDSDASEGVFSKEQFDDKNNMDNYEIGDFVIFSYEKEYFVGKIESVNAEATLIRAMQKSLKNWKWPEKEDINLYATCDIKEKIKTPRKINSKREFFYVPEMAKYWDFIN